ncbi:sister chromatid cohesion 1 protein 3 isoform X2 [Euphorbia lathyris]|uniref:sister chromatid cohesion 1 protein 3 isoform X2 n=1 Tax=Euphorbia lathyris TaxID=212925 RepID=UPI003313FEC0
MFYSQTFLARKGPLGTVWCAAHLQHRLKKSHYTSTDIPYTVDCIMFPEVPIALRMSGHLLVGVVRIYSKKVDYLYHDCNVALVAVKKAFDSTEVNLPENATTAKFDAVTLPLTFDLDDFDIDVDMDPNSYGLRFLDDHTRSPEEITLEDQVHLVGDPYVVVTFKDMMMDVLQPENDDLGVRHSTSEDSNRGSPSPLPSNQIEVPATNVPQGLNNQTTEGKDHSHLEESNQAEPTNDFQDLGLSKAREDLNTAPNDANSPPEIEVMRDQSNILENIQPFEDLQNDISEPKGSSNRGLDEESPAPFEDILPFQEQTSPFHQRTESPNFMHSHEASKINDTPDLLGHMPSELKMRSTPPVQSPKPRQRKRKNYFDECTVLSNKFMKNALKNSSDVLRKRREIPSTALGIWKMRNALRKEQVFSEPLLTGSCADICHHFKRDFISTKPHPPTLQSQVTLETMVIEPLLESEPTHNLNAETSSALAGEVIWKVSNETSLPPPEVVPEPMNVTLSVEPSAPEYEPETDVEIEHLRHADGFDGSSMIHELVLSPERAVHSPGLPSPFRRDELTPHSPKSIGSETVHRSETSTETSLLPTQDYAAEMETPRTDLEGQFDAGQSGLSYIPESGNIPETEDLSFLEADNSLFGSQGTEGIDSLSVRTRAVVQYLLRQSPVGPISEDQPEDLSLNKILEGKTRKSCARMFFETLVLKTYGLIDVRQEQAYGDISLKLTSTLARS